MFRFLFASATSERPNYNWHSVTIPFELFLFVIIVIFIIFAIGIVKTTGVKNVKLKWKVEMARGPVLHRRKQSSRVLGPNCNATIIIIIIIIISSVVVYTHFSVTRFKPRLSAVLLVSAVVEPHTCEGVLLFEPPCSVQGTPRGRRQGKEVAVFPSAAVAAIDFLAACRLTASQATPSRRPSRLDAPSP